MSVNGEWSYSGDPSTSALDEVRFLIGDTDEDDQQLADHEILYLIDAAAGSASDAAIAAASRLVAAYTRRVTVEKSVGDLRLVTRYEELRSGYIALRDHLIAIAGSVAAPIPYAGGISIADMQSRDEDTDRVPPLFEIGQDDAPGPRTVRSPRWYE